MVSFHSLALFNLQRTSVLVGAAAALLLVEDERANAVSSLNIMSDDTLMDMISTSIDDLGLANDLTRSRRKRRAGQDVDNINRKKRMVKYDRERAYKCIFDDYLSQN